MVSVAERGPSAVGENKTVITQLLSGDESRTALGGDNETQQDLARRPGR